MKRPVLPNKFFIQTILTTRYKVFISKGNEVRNVDLCKGPQSCKFTFSNSVF